MRFTNPAPATGGPTVVWTPATLDVPSGTMRAVIGTPPAGVGWWVDRVTVELSSPTTAYLYVGAVTNANLVTGTRTGQIDTTSGQFYVPPLSPLTVVWLTNTGTGGARAEYQPRAV